MEKGSVNIVTNTSEGALTFDDKFTADEGMFIAAALTAYDSETEPIDDPRHGALVI